MKIISLNIWGGRVGSEKVLAFFEQHKSDVDIFCLQEVWSAPYEHLEGVMAGGRSLKLREIMVYGKQEISKLLFDHAAYFHPQYQDDYGLLLLVHKKYQVVNVGEVFVHLHKGYEPESPEEIGAHARNVQYVTIETEKGPLTLMNFHGLWNGKGKTDTPERLTQSDNIATFLQTLATPVVFCGDFNLLPDTESIKKIEDSGLRNLIKEYGITSTRTSHYDKSEKFADYIFVDKKFEIKDFKVLSDEVSDHSPLLLELA
jgi:endonuclease/exonuclease/phosphatase family metal-dependent hydrolase